MNLKVANLVAIQFGIFIGIMSWLGYSRLPSAQPNTAAEMQERTVARTAPVAPVLEPRNQRSHAVGYRADRERARPVTEQQEPSAEEDDQEITAGPYVNSRREEGSIVEAPPSYAMLEQERTAVQPDYQEAPQTDAYAPSTQILVYPQPQLVVFSNARPFGHRSRSMFHPGTHTAIAHPRPDKDESNVSDAGIACRPIVSAPFCRPAQGMRPRGHR